MTYLNELLDADNFKDAVESSGKKLRETYKLPEISQLGLVVGNAEMADTQMVCTSSEPSGQITA